MIDGMHIDHNCLVEIDTPSRPEAMRLAYLNFGPKFSNVYHAMEVTKGMLDYFPHGIIKVELEK
jgi:hypothetical protein